MLAGSGCVVDGPGQQEAAMGGKNKGGREARKPKQDQNKKAKGQTPSPVAPALDGMNAAGHRTKK